MANVEAKQQQPDLAEKLIAVNRVSKVVFKRIELTLNLYHVRNLVNHTTHTCCVF